MMLGRLAKMVFANCACASQALCAICGSAEKIRLYLNETNFDMDSYKELCRKADRLRRIGTIGIDFETMLNCRIGIMNGKYKDPKQTEQEKINERAKRELEETKKLLAEYKNYKGVPMPESFKELGRKWGLR